MRNHRKALGDLGVAGLWSFLRISVPSCALSASKHLTGVIDPTLLGVAGVALGAAAALVDVQKQHRKLLADTPWHYAWKVARTFR